MAKRIGANSRRRCLERSTKRRRWGGAVVVAAAIIASAIGGAALLYSSDVVRIRPFVGQLFKPRASIVTTMTVVGGGHVTAGQIMDRLGFRFPMPFSSMKKKFVKKFGRVSPWIEKAELCGPREGIVTVVITERKPVAIAATTTVCLVDSAGAYIPFDPRAAQRLPFISGLRDSAGAESRYLTNEDCGRMNRFFRGLAAFDPQIASRVTQVCFGPHGAATIWLEGSPTEIALDGNNLENGLERLMRLLPSMRSDSCFPSRIDLSCRNLAFVTVWGTAGESAEKVRQKG
jgi:hypothetical protein